MEDDHHYHKQPPQDDHLTPRRLERVQVGKEDGHGYVGGQNFATAGGNMPQTIFPGVP